MSGQLFLHSNISNETVPYFNIFKTSVGGSNGDGEYFKGIGKLYKTNPRFQRGYGLQSGKFNHTKKRGTGIGSFFQSLWRVAFPMIKSGAKKLGSTALDVATNVAADALQGKNIKESAKEHITQKGTALLADIKQKGVEVLKNINPTISGLIDKSTQPEAKPLSLPVTSLAAPSPQKFRRLSRKRKSEKVSYKIPKKSKYPGLKYLN